MGEAIGCKDGQRGAGGSSCTSCARAGLPPGCGRAVPAGVGGISAAPSTRQGDGAGRRGAAGGEGRRGGGEVWGVHRSGFRGAPWGRPAACGGPSGYPGIPPGRHRQTLARGGLTTRRRLTTCPTRPRPRRLGLKLFCKPTASEVAPVSHPGGGEKCGSAGAQGSRPPSAATSPRVRGRQRPLARPWMPTGPMAVRTSLRTLLPTASIMRRTWRLRPSVMVISRQV